MSCVILGDSYTPNKTKNSYVAPIKFSSLSDLAEKAFLLGPKVKSSTGRNNLSNDGALGESVAKNILEAATGAKYRGIQNGSGNGPDLIRINKETKTIEHVEVKSKMPTSNPNTHKTPVSWPDGKPDERFRTWILEARTGKISGKSVSKDDREYAEQIYQLLYGPNATYTLDNKVMQVVLPKINETGNTIAKLFKWTGSTKPSERLK
ncbi:hypothetical protein QL898_10345 [Psychrobacter sp. APC 3279]|uniref:hypothetical protein n=1 Tax=Psychrobacter sp. APC 3279 TaxID=3035189 RepID=UPI0025B59759|nr:hypothetical protein [Psychrobacter sp. APC 3279]MDN3442033.1 hypothetical protein [Psychrobacter sp. APC 3279]